VSDDPADRVTLDESVSYALLTVLERLSPAERTGSCCTTCSTCRSAITRRSFAVSDGGVTRIDAIRNPENLRRL